MEGLHTQLPEDEIGAETVTWCRDLWWTLYIMDRHFSASVGLPMSVHDSEITTPINPPDHGSHADSLRSLQVKLSHLMSMILRSRSKGTGISRNALTLMISRLQTNENIPGSLCRADKVNVAHFGPVRARAGKHHEGQISNFCRYGSQRHASHHPVVSSVRHCCHQTPAPLYVEGKAGYGR